MISRDDIEAMDDQGFFDDTNLKKDIYKQIQKKYGDYSEENIRKFWKQHLKVDYKNDTTKST